MLQKLFTFLIALCLIGAINSSYAGNKGPVKIVDNGDVLRGYTGPYVPYNGPPARIDNSPAMGPFYSPTNDNILATVIMKELDPAARSTYDLCSNGVTHWLYMEPANPLHIHAEFMTSTIPATWDDRNARYFYSSDAGVTWTYLGTVGATRSGFPCLYALPDGRALTCMHNTDGGSVQNGQLYVDISSGAGSFNRLNPGLHSSALGQIWEVCAGTNSKAFIVGSQNSTSNDSVEVNTTTSYTPPGTWLGWKAVNNAANAQNYSVAIGTGKWGVAYNTSQIAPATQKGAAIIESTDEGVTWGAPVNIWTESTSDSLGTLRSIDLIYEGANPRVTFGLCHEDANGFYPGLSSKQMFWAPDINGGVPVTVDQAPGLSGSNTTNDVFVSCCRGTIGKSTDGAFLYIGYNKARTDTSSIGNNYFDVYLTYSTNHGATWASGTQLTNLSGQGILADYRYVSVSPNNPPGIVYVQTSRDTVPGSNVNGAPPSIMRDMFITVTNLIGIKNIGSEVPKNFALQQNYPNPFNPSTKIRFELPTTGFVNIKLYDVLGKEVATIVNENLTAGVKEVEYNASNLPSGVYFYTIRTGSFVDTKKMVLTK